MPNTIQEVRVATVCQANLDRGSRDKLVEYTLERLDWAASSQPDIVCLPEHWPDGEPEAVPGPTTEKVMKWAKEHACYVISPLYADVDGQTHNSAVLIDRHGNIMGRYDKIHPTTGEMEKNLSPAPYSDPPVFELDFGTIGIQICFDVNWHDTWARLKEKGAQIVFWPSAYPASTQLTALAWQNEYYVVSSTMARSSSIYDISGRVLDQSGAYRQWATASLRLDKRLFEIDYHVKTTRKIEAKYGTRVNVEWFHDDDWFTLASLDPHLSVDSIIEEFEMTPLRAYHAKCKEAIEKARRSG